MVMDLFKIQLVIRQRFSLTWFYRSRYSGCCVFRGALVCGITWRCIGMWQVYVFVACLALILPFQIHIYRHLPDILASRNIMLRNNHYCGHYKHIIINQKSHYGVMH